jgi:hypothetical protein
VLRAWVRAFVADALATLALGLLAHSLWGFFWPVVLWVGIVAIARRSAMLIVDWLYDLLVDARER